MEHWLTDLNSTHCLGMELAQPLILHLNSRCNIVSVLLLSGNLGSGKTSLVQGLAKGLNILDPVVSPTFTLSQLYQGRINENIINLIHIDLYRLNQIERADEFFVETLNEAIDFNTIIVVEWPERLSSISKNYWNVRLTIEKRGRRVFIIPPISTED